MIMDIFCTKILIQYVNTWRYLYTKTVMSTQTGSRRCQVNPLMVQTYTLQAFCQDFVPKGVPTGLFCMQSMWFCMTLGCTFCAHKVCILLQPKVACPSIFSPPNLPFLPFPGVSYSLLPPPSWLPLPKLFLLPPIIQPHLWAHRPKHHHLALRPHTPRPKGHSLATPGP